MHVQPVNDKRSLVSGAGLKGAIRLLLLQACLASICIWMGLLLYAAGPEEAFAARGMMAAGLMPVLALVVSSHLLAQALKGLLIAAALMLLVLDAVPVLPAQGFVFPLLALTCAAGGLWLGGSRRSPIRN